MINILQVQIYLAIWPKEIKTLWGCGKENLPEYDFTVSQKKVFTKNYSQFSKMAEP